LGEEIIAAVSKYFIVHIPVKYLLKIKLKACMLLACAGFIISAKCQNNQNDVKKADSLYNVQNWSGASTVYQQLLTNTQLQLLVNGRLGLCYYHLGNYGKALYHYNQALGCKNSAPVANVIYARMARVYAKQGKSNMSLTLLDSAVTKGYSNSIELDSLDEYKDLHSNGLFKNIVAKAYKNAYPCSTDPQSRLYDFWLGNWIVYNTGSNAIIGYSYNEKQSGECMILESWVSYPNQYSGVAMNFFDPEKGKWEKVWVGSEGGPGVVHHYVAGDVTDNAMRFVYELKDEKGEMQPGRYTIYNLADGKARLVKELSPDKGKTFDVLMDLTYVRTKL